MGKKMARKINSYFLTGTDAFKNILKEINLEEKSEIIVPVTLCESIINVIIEMNYTPIFCDINNNFLINEIENKITDKTKIIIFVEQYGFTIQNSMDYFNLKREKIIKILDSCQNIIKTNGNFDYIFYSFSKNKPYNLGKYSLVTANHNIKSSIKMPLTYKTKLILKRSVFFLVLYKRIIIQNIIKRNIKIPGNIITFGNTSFHRIIYIMQIDKSTFDLIDERIYEYMKKNNLDIVQTTIEIAPYENLGAANKFPNYTSLRYKALYFRPNFKLKQYKQIINYINGVYYETK